MLVFLEYIFQFLINKALLASNGVDRQNFIGKRFKDDKFTPSFGAGFRGAIGSASKFMSEVWGSILLLGNTFYFSFGPFVFFCFFWYFS